VASSSRVLRGERLRGADLTARVEVPYRVDEIGHLSVREYYRYVERDAMARLKTALPAEARVWCKPDACVVCGKAYREILKVAEEDGAELVVIGVHGTPEPAAS
jgi:nucleotide-binding universal stress UspA family protein